MLAVLLLISLVTCDWVEISQNQYKQEPPRRATQPTIINRYEEKPKDNKIYRNNSVTEKQWNKATIDRVTNLGNIRRVQELSVKTPSVKLRPDANDYSKLSDNIGVNNRHDPELASIRKSFREEEISGKRNDVIHKEVMTKLTNVVPVKRLQVINNSDANNSGKPFPQNPLSSKRVPIDDENFFPNQASDENKIYKGHGNKMSGIISGETTNRNSDLNDGDYSIRNFQRLPTTGENLPHKHKSKFFTTTPIPKTTRIDAIFDKNNTRHFQKISAFEEENEDLKESSMENYLKFSNTSITPKSKFRITKLDKIHIENTDDGISQLDLPNMSNLKTFPRLDFHTNIPERSIIRENIEETTDKKEDVVDIFEEVSNATKKETMGAIWKLVKIVTDIIYKNTHRSFKSKVKYLEGLKATILSTIEEQFEQVWPDDMEHRGSWRRGRSAQARGHVEFPSSESTLMTISFLTFAVFLIKLVLDSVPEVCQRDPITKPPLSVRPTVSGQYLRNRCRNRVEIFTQLIHTYKSKTMMVTPAVVAAVGRAAAALRSQN